MTGQSGVVVGKWAGRVVGVFPDEISSGYVKFRSMSRACVMGLIDGG